MKEEGSALKGVTMISLKQFKELIQWAILMGGEQCLLSSALTCRRFELQHAQICGLSLSPASASLQLQPANSCCTPYS